MKFIRLFRFQVVLRVGLLALTLCFIFAYLLPFRYYAGLIAALIAVVLQVVYLIRFVEKSNRQLRRFLASAQYQDAGALFSGDNMGPPFDELAAAMNLVMDNIRRSRSEKEDQYRYLQTVVHHLRTGLVVFSPDGRIDLINTAAKRLLKIARAGNIKNLEAAGKQFAEAALALQHGEKTLVKIGDKMELSLHASKFLRGDHSFTLVSFQDIMGELQEKEMQAWQNLIRVLTHEIMNSMTPITSMTDTLQEWLKPVDTDQNPDVEELVLSTETAGDIRDALKTINKRGKALTHFVSTFRNLTLIPQPQLKLFTLSELLERVQTLLQARLGQQNIAFTKTVEPPSLELTADPALIEQVLINLVINSLDALHDTPSPSVDINASQDDSGRVVIRVADNGHGIIPEAVDKIFTPLFTTKKAGSGIGLSLSRQIMKLHRGHISVHSKPNVETVFTLRF